MAEVDGHEAFYAYLCGDNVVTHYKRIYYNEC